MSYTRTEGRPQRDTVIPRFHVESVIDPVATAKEGRDIYKDEERVQFMVPGGLNQPVERVNDSHIQRWPEEYKKFKNGQEMSATGTPLEQWAVLSRAMVLELKAIGFFTVEQLAEMTDQAMQRIRTGGHRIRELAKQYLDDSYAQAEANKLLIEKEAQLSRIAELENKVAELSQLLNSVHRDRQALLDRPSELATYVPAHHDPVSLAMARAPAEPAAPSALENLPAPRKRGRPSNAEIAARGA